MPEEHTEQVSENNKKRHTFQKFCTIASLVLLLVAIGFGFNAYRDYKRYKVAEEDWNKIQEIAHSDDSDNGAEDTTVPTIPEHHIVDSKDMMDDPSSIEEMDEETDEYLLERIDMDSLKAINSDVVMWIRIPGTSVDYPAMQEPSYPIDASTPKYLYANMYNEYSICGSLFIPALYKNQEYEEGYAHTIIYGHNMRDGSMLGTLSEYKSYDFYEEHPYFYVYHTDRTERWLICSIAHIQADAKLYRTPYKLGTEEYKAMQEELRKLSYYDTGVTKFNEYIPSITLSTCDWTYTDKSGRMVVTAMLDKTLYWG